MNDCSRYLLTLPELRAAGKHHGWKGLCVAGGLFVLIAVGTFLLPRQYVSEAKMFVRIGHESLTLDPTVTTNQTVSIYETRDSEINSLLEVLRSREVLEGIIDVLGIDAILHHGPLPEPAVKKVLMEAQRTPDQSTTPLPRSYDAEREQAVLKLEQMLSVGSPKRTNIIVLHCKADSPQLAQATLDTLLSVYRNVHAEVNSTPASYRFFEAQVSLLHTRWQQAATELKSTKDRMQLASLEGKRTIWQNQWNDVEQQLQTLRINTAASAARIAELETKLLELPQFRTVTRTEANAVSDSMRTTLFQLHSREKELLAKYADSHPFVTSVRNQIAALQNVQNTEDNSRSLDTNSANPAADRTELALLEELSQRQANSARMTEIAQQRERLLGELHALNRDEIQLAELQQTVDLASQAHRETALRLEQARIQRDLTQERISNLNIIQPATFVSKAIAPKRTLMLALGTFVSSLFGVATILGLAYMKRHFTTVQEIAEQLHLPIITKRPIPTLSRGFPIAKA